MPIFCQIKAFLYTLQRKFDDKLDIMNIERIGLRICTASGEVAPKISEWYPEVNNIFIKKYWVATCFDCTPFGGVCYKYGEELMEQLIYQKPPSLYSQLIFKPEAMAMYYEFVHNDWVNLYGIDENKIGEVLQNWENNSLNNILLEMADPYIHNADGWWWDLFFSDIISVRRCLASNKQIKMEDISISESLKY